MEALMKMLKDPNNKQSSLEKIASIQQLMAQQFPFENIDVLLQNETLITESFLRKKLLEEKRGGLCYELNGLLYLLLKELGLNAQLSAATMRVDDQWGLDRTHAIVLYEENDILYLLDSGSGNNLPLQPLALDGPEVKTPSGTYRLRTKKTERGSIICEYLTENGWALRFAFDPKEIPWDELNRMKKLIHTDEKSPFNRTLLIAQSLSDGTISLTEERFRRRWTNGKETETKQLETVDEIQRLIHQHFSPSIQKAARQYFKLQK